MSSDPRLALIQSRVRDVPDFPKPGILFKDITPVLSDPAAFHAVLDLLAERYRDAALDRIVGMESRGFIFGAALADRLGVGFTPVRKKGKLPSDVISVTYSLEYGTDTLEMHRDGVSTGHRVLVVDDLLATGGTARAAIDLVTRLGGVVVGCAFVIELAFLNGREKLMQNEVFSLLTF